MIPTITLCTQQWNDRDQLVNKTLGGGLQSIDYLYNERGWLRQINQPLDLFTPPTTPPECGDINRIVMEDMDMMDMIFCGSVVADLNELLSNRFDPNLNVDCYNPCKSSEFTNLGGVGAPSCTRVLPNSASKVSNTPPYTIERDIPCHGGIQTVTRPDISQFPAAGNTLYRVRFCDGTEQYLWQEAYDLLFVPYVDLQTIEVQSLQQLFTYNDGCGETQIINVEGLILAVGVNAANIAIDNFVLVDKDNLCDPLSPDCTPEEQQEQQDYIGTLTADPLTDEDVAFPFYLVRVKLCNGNEVHLTTDELRNLPHAHVELQRIFVSNESQTFQVGSNVSTVDTKDLFYQSLHYDDYDSNIDNDTLKNGNISYMTWQTAGMNEQIHKFGYDPLNRITFAIFGERDASDLMFNNLYSTVYGEFDSNGTYVSGSGYDANGNIKKIRFFEILCGIRISKRKPLL